MSGVMPDVTEQEEILTTAAENVEIGPQAVNTEEATPDDSSAASTERDNFKRLSVKFDFLINERGMRPNCEVLVGRTKSSYSLHRKVLADASPVLANMIRDANPDNCSLVIPNIEADIFRLVCVHIYTGYVIINSCDVASSLYQAAQHLNIPKLQKECKTYILDDVSPESVLPVFEIAEKVGDSDVKEKCLEEMVINAEKVLSGRGVETASVDTLVSMFSLPMLNVSSELELFKAAERWVDARCNTKPQCHNSGLAQATGDAKPKAEDAVTLIRRALQQIRFLALKPEEFANYDMSTLLSEPEIFALLLNLNSKNTYKPMPDGFSNSRKERRQQPNIIRIDISKLGNFKSAFDYKLCSEVADVEWIMRTEKMAYIVGNSIVYVNLDCYWKDKNCKDIVTFDAIVEFSVLRDKEFGFRWKEKNNFQISGNEDFWYEFAIDTKPLLDVANGYVKDGAINIAIKITALSIINTGKKP